jgi:carotenoid cleavage dioxygenase-like enzyme
MKEFMIHGAGNTALVFHNKNLLALDESDRPYSIKVLENGDLQTVGIEDYGQKLNHPFTAHPKIDPVTGEMFIFSYSLFAPQFIYRVVSKDGIVGVPVPITMPGPVIMHDFAISENYAIFMDLPLFLDIWGLAKGDFIIKFDPNKESRLGIFPRYGTNGSQIRWFKIPSCFVFHTVNAWEEGDEVILTACVKDNIDLNPVKEFTGKKAWGVGSRLYEFRMNLKTGEVKMKQLSILRADFPRINPEYTGRKVRYVYCAVFDEQDKNIGVAKYDLSMEPTMSRELKAGGNIAGVFHYGPGRVGGDPIFVPRKPGAVGVSEDDGYLISFVHDGHTE